MAEHVTETEPTQRSVHTLNEAERDAIWQYGDPIWPACYSWHPTHGWIYCTRSNPAWRASNASDDGVNTRSITGSTTGPWFAFVELCRFRHDHMVLFTPSGPVRIPDSIADTLPPVDIQSGVTPA